MRLHDLFLAAVRDHATRIAVDVPPGPGRPLRSSTTYAELAAQAGRVQGALLPLAAPERVVAILLPRDSAALPATQIGVLMAGAAHVCLDPSFPDEHLRHVLADSAACAVVTDRAGRARLAASEVPVLEFGELLRTSSGEQPVPVAHGGDRALAYVIYTSGTTGRPKGVLLEHAGAVSLVRSGIARFALGPGDRVAQGSSAAYDSSIEETWLALASGATLVVLDDATVRLGPDLVPWLARERITVFCPPPTLLRAMDCADPASALPALRLCYVGGEAMPDDLVERWGRGLWLENGYGPTESTVTALRGRLVPGEPVTIGTPVPGTTAHVLDAELREVAADVEGELCLGGLGLARGYLGLPELTAERFVRHPTLGRVYRTGDLAMRLPDGRLRCFGRIDTQVKVRGHRIELEAVEAELARCVGVREAACAVRGDAATRTLAAWIVPSHVAPDPGLGAIAAELRERLPEHMVPTHLGVLRDLPRTIGGKLDRKRLPELTAPRGDVPPERISSDALVGQVADAIAATLGLAGPPAEDADFFALGGDSLRAALLVSRLRKGAATRVLTVRDVYEARTPRALALRARATPPAAHEPGREAGSPTPRRGSPFWTTAIQTLWLLAELALGSWLAYVVAFVVLPWLHASLGTTRFVLLAPLVGALLTLAFAAAALWLAVATKELLIGRYTPRVEPAFGTFHLRHWIVVHVARHVPWGLFEATGLASFALRALGARIGTRVHFDRGVDLARGGWDLLTVGDGATLCREVALGLVEYDAGSLVIGRVEIGAGATLEARAGVGTGTSVGAGARLCALSFLNDGEHVPPREVWDGVPARRSATASAAPVADVRCRDLGPFRFGAALVGLRLAGGLLPALVLVALAAWLWHEGGPAPRNWVLWAVLAPVLGLPLWLLVQALALRWSAPAPLGTVPRASWPFVRAHLRTGILESAGTWLSGTLFWPVWLRLAGMRIGRNTEVSTILDVLPEHCELGPESFLADGIYLGVPRHHGAVVTFAHTSLGARTFLGNHVLVHGGQSLPDDLLLGVSTVAPAGGAEPGSAWFGHPPFPLPRREVVTLDRRLTHEPGAIRYFNRVFWEALRTGLPALPAALAVLWYERVVAAAGDVAGVLLVLPLATLGVGAALTLVVLGSKWLLLGRVRPGQHALWSCWASRWDFHYVVWQRYCRGLLTALEGTLLLPWFLRAMGMRIGRRVLLGDGFAQVVDPDMLTLGDDSTVHALFQAHSFEDRVLKIDHVRIGSGASVGRGSVLLYGAEIGERARVLPHSVVMKREVLLADRTYAGAPSAEVAARAPQPAPDVATQGLADRPGAPGRVEALDAARGLAVALMVWLHFVPSDGSATRLDAATAWLGTQLEGRAAALFALLAGMTFSMQARRFASASARRTWLVRRTLTLGIAGALLWVFVWPTEVLLPLALMLPVVVALGRGSAAKPLLAALALLLATPVLAAALGPYVAIDCLEDGTHLANTKFGWCTLRYFLFDGSYPLVPWLALPLLGAALVAADLRDRARCVRWVFVAAPLTLVAWMYSTWVNAEHGDLGVLTPYLGATWQPTTLPFLLGIGGSAVTVVAGLAAWRARRAFPRWLQVWVAIGRTSLTHYLLHVLLVFAPLRLVWPAEDWDSRIGILAAIGYLAFALAASGPWLARFRHGPCEALFSGLSGGSTRTP